MNICNFNDEISKIIIEIEELYKLNIFDCDIAKKIDIKLLKLVKNKNKMLKYVVNY